MYSRSLAHKFRKEYRQIEIDKFIRAEIYILIDSFLEQNICFRGSNVAWLGAFPASYMPLFMYPPPRLGFLSVFIPVSRQPPPMCTTYPFVREISISLHRYRHPGTRSRRDEVVSRQKNVSLEDTWSRFSSLSRCLMNDDADNGTA